MRFIKGNVEKIAETPKWAAKLKAEGFRELSEMPANIELNERLDLERLNLAELKTLPKKKIWRDIPV